MGVPTLNKFATKGYARGDELYANDGAILAQTQGNLENRINIVEFANHFMVHVNFRAAWTAEGQAVSPGSTWDAVEFVLPTSCRLVGYNWVGFDHNGESSDQQYTFHNNGAKFLTAPLDCTNKVNVQLLVKGLDLRTKTTLAAVEMDESNKDFGSDLSGTANYLAQGWLCIVQSTFNADSYDNTGSTAGERFDPWIQGNFLFKEEHV